MDDGGDGSGASQRRSISCSLRQALELDPRYRRHGDAVALVGRRQGARRISESGCYRDKRLRSIVDYPKLYEGFPGVKIRGGISYFLWDRDYERCRAKCRPCWDGQPTSPAVARHLDAYDVLVRRNEAVPILDKVLWRAKGELDARCSPVSSKKAVRSSYELQRQVESVAGMQRSGPSLSRTSSIGCIERADITT
ncbi:MAG: Eco57I restriction-modification methylase domain-containing protein [Anaerolineae bacterium]